jgi:predicted AlkP superfamily pyrophosphatase or phosphodiesterase
MKRLRGVAAAGTIIGLSCSPPPVTTSSPPPGSDTAVRLVLVVAIDQMRYDYLTRFGPLFKGGFRRLLDRGAVFSNARYPHANTETGPGHAMLISGLSSRHSGIIANEWYDPVLKREVNVVEDPVVSPLGGSGRGGSPTHFVGFTIGDLLKKRTPGSRVVGVALKDRAAVLMAGPRADAAYWYETTGGNFITSTYYMKEAPRWLTDWNTRRRADAYAGRAWTRLLPDEGVYREFAGEDKVDGEWDWVDTVFPHKIRGRPPSSEFYDDLRRTPFADELTLEVALEAITAYRLGSDADTDLLAVGFSASDVIGHTYGPDSHEIMDQMLRLDVTLERLIEAAETRTGAGGTLLVLGADHGVTPLVERMRAAGVDARRVRPAALKAAVDQALAARFPRASGLLAWARPPEFQLDLEALRRQGLKRRTVEAVVEKALLSTGAVARVYTHDRLLGEPPAGDPFFALFRNSFFEPRSPHVIGLLKEHVYVTDRLGGAGHGGPYEDDRHVPVAFLGRGVKPGTYDEPCGPEDVAPSLAALLALEYPRQDHHRVLKEMWP